MTPNGLIEVEFCGQKSAHLSVQGPLDETASILFLSHFHRLIRQGYCQFICDLSDSASVTGSGLGLLSYCNQELSTLGGRFVLLSQSEQIAKLLRLTKLKEVTEVASSLDEAMYQIGEL